MAASLGQRPRERRRVRVDGTVQGVGFRPFVHRLARELDLDGWVGNDARGVVLEAEGSPEALDELLRRLAAEAPPLARVEGIEAIGTAATGARGFAIAASAAGRPDAPVTPDAATCADCLRELFDPGNRRFRYPFVNCTNCGPRLTIVCGVPYDRPRTTMAGFRMCRPCRAEYEDPADRRFHAQPNACPDCGPRAWLVDPAGRPVDAPDAVRAAAGALRSGRIVAVKGVGGFHLACLAADEAAVAALRTRKHREDRPFALMARDVAAARELVELGPEEEALLASPERPIVLAARRPRARVAAGVAPGAGELGVMLPYSPLHHLLSSDVGEPLVMTSGNLSDEPIAYRDEDAPARLGGLADLLLVHDRPIRTRVDDSVARVARIAGRRKPVLLRRSRGFAPRSLTLPVPAGRPLLACGAELKNAFCLARGRRAWMSHHIGDVSNYETRLSFQEGIEHFEALFDVVCEVVAHDLHPDYGSTAYARERDGVERVAVQHHHAHLAAGLAEHGRTGPGVGLIYDGAGLGPDGSVWGGEVLVGGLGGYERAGHLLEVGLPGGDRAAREPWRMACAWLTAAAPGEVPTRPLALRERIDATAWKRVSELSRSELAPRTSSMGRLFDAVAALCGLRTHCVFEGQAAMELEAIADPHERGSYRLEVTGGVLDARPAIRSAAADVEAGAAPAVVSARFHAAVADASVRAAAAAAERARTETVVLSGGVFQNARLLAAISEGLAAAGLRVLAPEALPANDGGIAFGQAAVAAWAMTKGRRDVRA